VLKGRYRGNMGTRHRDFAGANPSAAEAIDRHPRADPEAALLQRVRIALAMIAGAVVLTTLIDLSSGQVPPGFLLTSNTINLALVALFYQFTRWSRATRHAIVVAWSVPAIVCAMLALSGIVSGDIHAAVIMSAGTVLITATIFPWGLRPQLATVACAGLAIAANLHWVSNDPAIPVSYEAVAGAVLSMVVSIVITYERQLTWQAMRNENQVRVLAEAQTATLHQHLERIVTERTALLEATRQDLERQIADHEAALRLLRETQQQLLDIVDNSSALIFVKGLDGRYRFIGIQGEARLKMPRDQIIGKTVADLFPGETAAASEASDRVVLATNQALETEDTVVGPGGARTYLTLRFPLRDAAGVVYGLCGISTDITKRKQMETELRRTEALLSSVIESSDQAIWSVDRRFRFTALNSVVRHRFRELFGTEPEVGSALDACLPPATREFWRTHFEQALSGQSRVVDFEGTIDGAPRQLLVSLNPVTEGGSVTGVVVFTKDITRFRRAEEQARQHQAELAHALRLSTIGEMSTGLAQDLRRPLMAIVRTADDCQQTLQSGPIDPAALAQRIGQVTAEALGAAESLRHLRRLVRKNSSPLDGIDVNEVTRNAVRIVAVRHPELPLHVSLAPDLPLVRGDRIQLEQVVLNLLLNALDALQAVPTEARTLAVHTLLADGSAVEVSVRDTGAGLDPGLGGRMFAPFVTTKPKALGMGLAISRSIVEAHGGQLWVTPNPAGGSVFHFTVPLP